MLASLDFLLEPDFWIAAGILASVYGITGLGVQLNVGTTGLMNFGPVGFVAIGAYTMAILVVKLSAPLWVGLVAGVGLAVGVSVLVSLPALRLRADYFAITTLAFAEIVRYLVINQRDLAGGGEGIVGFDTTWRDASSSIQSWLESIGIRGGYLLPLLLVSGGTFVLLALILRTAVRTPWGRVMNAIRADEDAVRALGKNTFSFKLQSMMISAAVCAIAGYFLAFNLALVVPDAFDSTITIFAYTACILGGLGSYPGVMAGSMILVVILEGTRYLNLPLSPDRIASLRYIVVGLLLILLVAFRPYGIFGKREEMSP